MSRRCGDNGGTAYFSHEIIFREEYDHQDHMKNKNSAVKLPGGGVTIKSHWEFPVKMKTELST